MKRKETLLGQLEQGEEGVPTAAPDYPPAMKYGLITGGVFVVIFLAYTLLGFFFAPWLVKTIVPKEVEKRIGVTASIEKVSLNPFTLSGVIRGLQVNDKSGEVLLSLEEGRGNIQISSVFKGGLVVKEIILVGPYARVVRTTPTELNVFDLLPPPDPERAKAVLEPFTVPKVWIELLEVTNGKVEAIDQVPEGEFSAVFSPINFSINQFSTLGDEGNEMEFNAIALNGGQVSWQGTVDVPSLSSSGSFKLDSIKIESLDAYYSPIVNFVLETAVIDTEMDYRVQFRDGELFAEVSSGSVGLSEMVILSKVGTEEVIRVPSLEVTGISARWPEKDAEVEQVFMTGGSVTVVQSSERSVNLIEMMQLDLPVEDIEELEEEILKEGEALDIVIQSFVMEDYRVIAEDQVPSTPANAEVVINRLEMGPLSTDFSQLIGINGDYSLLPEGTIQVDGEARIDPLYAKVNVSADQLATPLIQPYLSDFLLIEMERGFGGFQGSIEVEAAPEASEPGTLPVVKIVGDGALDGFATVHTENPDELVSFQTAAARGLELVSDPLQIKADEIFLDALVVQVVRLADESILLPFPDAETEGEQVVVEAAEAATLGSILDQGVDLPVDLALGKLELQNTSFILVDEAVNPAFRGGVKGLSGTVAGLSNMNKSAAILDMSGTFDGLAAFTVTGTLTPFQQIKDSTISIVLRPLNMTVFNSYSGKYLGRELDKGTVEMELDYTLIERQIDGKNHVRVNQMELGEKVSSEDAINLPLDLGLALLKDKDGVIDLNVPVRGDIDDPNFKLGGVILQALGNIITKAVTAPFSLLGNMVGSEKELSLVAFDPGTSLLNTDGEEVLNLLIEALEDRPNVNIDVSGYVAPVIDETALKKKMLNRWLISIQQSEAGAPQGDFQADESVYVALLALLQENPEWSPPLYSIARLAEESSSGAAVTGLSPDPGSAAVPETETTEAGMPEITPEFSTETVELETGLVSSSPNFFQRWVRRFKPIEAPEQEPIFVERTIPVEPVAPEDLSPEPPTSEEPIAVVDEEEEPLDMAFDEEILPLEALEVAALSRLSLKPDDLFQLARFREQAVMTYFNNSGRLEAGRAFLVDPESREADQPQVEFSIKE